jgi:hypothetical protein
LRKRDGPQEKVQSHWNYACFCLQGGIFVHDAAAGGSGDQTLGIQMRKCALFLAVVMVATAPTVALAAKKKAAAPKKYDTTSANMNESGQRLVRNMWLLPVEAWNASVKKK